MIADRLGKYDSVKLPSSFVESDGSVVVNFGIMTGREATIAEVDRLARAVAGSGGDEIRIVAQRIHEYGGGIETVVHQVVARADGIETAELGRLCTEWVQDCAADRHIAPL
jgi:hypothetical protein